jgi:serpin B
MSRPITLASSIIILGAVGCAQPRVVTTVDADMAVVVEGNNGFAVDMYQQAALEPGNLFFSPFSITAALSMVYAGAEGDSEAEVAAAMGVVDEAAWHDKLGLLFDDLVGNHHRAYTLSGANRIWSQDDFELVPAFEDLMIDAYNAPVERMDISGDPDAATEHINKWVKRQTKGFIPELFGKGDISAATMVVLCNAVYFEGDWAEQFDKDNTVDGAFRTLGGGEVTVPLMHNTADYGYAELDGLRIAELPYEGDELSMVVLLPEADDGIYDLEADLTAAALADMLDQLDYGEVAVTLPSFTMDYELPLKDTLRALGIVSMFDPGAADLTGMAPGGGLYIEAARHKAYVDVFEQGTRAAAATGFGADLTAMPETHDFVADHPFVFLIRDMLTGSILFMGRVEDPR